MDGSLIRSGKSMKESGIGRGTGEKVKKAGDDVIAYSAAHGMSGREAEFSRERYGENRVEKGESVTLLRRFLGNFRDPIIRILLASCVLNAVMNLRDINWLEIGGILAAVFVSTFVSAVFEHSSAEAFERLSARSEEYYEVVRDGKSVKVAQSGIVVGDVVSLHSGAVIPCDGVMISGEINADQSVLTGESRSVTKVGRLADKGRFSRGSFRGETDSESEVFSGCGVVSGEGKILAVRVGAETVFGSIAGSLGGDRSESPLRERLGQLAKKISIVGYVGAGLVAAAYLFNVFFIGSGMSWTAAVERMSDLPFTAQSVLSALTLAVSVLVVAVPEGLPMMITVVLSSNMKRMIRQNVLVRRMVGIETSGSMSILFCDKTGTLTEGKMGIAGIYTPDGVIKSAKRLADDPLLCACAVCPAPGAGMNPTDRAFRDFAGGQKAGTVIRRIPFESERRFSAAAVKIGGEIRTVVRGAPEVLLPMIGYIREGGNVRRAGDADVERISGKVREISLGTGRVLLMCAASGDVTARLLAGERAELIYLGTAEITDRLRTDAAESVKAAQGAGVRVVMVTGDSAQTAQSVAGKCGILTDGGRCVSGDEVRGMSDAELDAMLPSLSVVSRALPSDKLRLVESARRCGLVSGMTGDGVNDAPSLAKADVGFAIGSGSEVAQAAADVVILDSSLRSIVSAVLFGRTIFRSIRKFVTFQLMMNLCATAVSFLGPFIGVEAPVTVVQMLWINMIMDTLGALAFAGEAPEERYLREAPVKRSEGLITGRMLAGILSGAAAMTAVCVFFLKAPVFSATFPDRAYFLTVFFVMMIFLGIFLSFSVRTDRIFPLAGISRNPTFLFIMLAASVVQFALVEFGGSAIRCVPLRSGDVMFAMGMACAAFPIDAVRKLILRRGK